ncbi:MAG: fumarate hydratase C-terminal domain-containing protein [Clostridia bacterium]|nr:fumarate hydratase C-terminal domain-containing protein [Clostridia bacterium]
MTKSYNTANIAEWADKLVCGEEILLSGVVYTARDAAHKRIKALIDEGKELPFELKNATVYYAGPTPEKPGMPIGSCGPTTSTRMDVFAPEFMDLGLKCMVGKGNRSQAVIDAIVRNKGVYLCAIGGAGALAANCVKKLDIIAFEDLGCESVKRLEIENFPLYVGIDSQGRTLFSAK